MKTGSAKAVRCAIYTRVSTDQKLEQDFNSLDAQYDASQAYVRSQAHAGWTLLRGKYDDGGFSGGDTDRPALQRLLEDVRAGKIVIACLAVYNCRSRNLCLCKTVWWGWEDSNFQPNDYQPLELNHRDTGSLAEISRRLGSPLPVYQKTRQRCGRDLVRSGQRAGRPSIWSCRDHSTGKSVGRVTPIPCCSRPSIAVLRRSGRAKPAR
jgi:hypothetical protein